MASQHEPNPIALEEWKLLEATIGRLEGLEFQVRGWLVALLVGLIAGFVASAGKFQPLPFAISAVAVTVAFSLTELVFRTYKRAAIKRVGCVEESLREPEIYPYCGPQINQKLSEEITTLSTLCGMWSELRLVNVWSFYGPLLLAGVAVLFFSTYE